MEGYANFIGVPLAEACADHGIDIEIDPIFHDYKSKFGEVDHVITWNVRFPPSWYEYYDQCNILYMGRGLLGVPETIVYMDTKGWFEESALCAERHFDIEPSDDELKKVKEINSDVYGSELFTGGNLNGPILYALQGDADVKTNYHFSGRIKKIGSVASGLQILSKYFKEEKVLVRPHPAFLDFWNERKDELTDKYFGPNWSVDVSENPYDIIKQCSALVTINSTLAIASLGLGIPVATLGDSMWNGSETMLECSDNPENLRKLLAFKADETKVINFLCAVERHQVYSGCRKEDILNNQEFQKWIQKIK